MLAPCAGWRKHNYSPQATERSPGGAAHAGAGLALHRADAGYLTTVSEVFLHLPTFFGKLVFVAACRDPNTGRYSHKHSVPSDAAEVPDHVFRTCHKRLFAEWLGYSLSQQTTNIQLFLEMSLTGPSDVSATSFPWHCDLSLVPETALRAERNLFYSDLRLLVSLLELTGSLTDSTPRIDPRIISAVLLADAGDLKALTLKSVSQDVGLSSDYFRKLFKQSIGESFADFMHHIRMKEAARLLRDTRAPAEEVAYQTGYSGPTNFGIAFKSAFGLTPRQYRRFSYMQIFTPSVPKGYRPEIIITDRS